MACPRQHAQLPKLPGSEPFGSAVSIAVTTAASLPAAVFPHGDRATGPIPFAPSLAREPPAHGRFALTSHSMDAAVDPDAMLMLAYARGDLAAFEALYAKHRGMLYRFLLRSLRDPQRTDELFQETWSRVIAARARYQPQAKFSTWLLQIAHNLLVDALRRQRPTADGEEAELALARVAIPEHEQPEHAWSDFERRRNLQRAIEQLPDEQRTAILLRLEQELSLEEIAEVTGSGRETVKSRLRYAMTRLREALSE
jgi:RNA polymerase sigma-70 factor (ECF subfamily)